MSELYFDSIRTNFVVYRDLIKNFDGSQWGQNGPEVLTRVLKNLCGFSYGKFTKYCDSFTLLPSEKCYAIKYQNWKDFFEVGSVSKVMKMTEDSYYVHLWNKFSHNKIVKIDADTALNRLSKRHCPGVYNTLEDHL